MKISVIGAGMMGSVIAWDLARSSDVDEIRVADISEQRLTRIKERLRERVSITKLDVSDRRRVQRFLTGNDSAVSALPHGIIHPADVAAVDCGAKLVNTAFEDEQMDLDMKAKSRGSVLIPGCGVAPGLSNIFVAEGMRAIDTAEEGHIYVGGIPQHPEPPFFYRLVFSVKGLIREYVSARVVRDGEVKSVEPFSEVERVRFPEPIGTLEAFVTDGLGSSIYTLRGLRQLDEKTLRHPGHADRIKFLLDAGFFSGEKVKVGDKNVAPVDVSAAILQKVLMRGDPKDVTVMRVETIGIKSGKRIRIRYELIDYYDESNGITSMGRTTGFTAAIVARMLGRGEIDGTGVLPPEIALGLEGVKRLLGELASKGVTVKRTTRPA